MTGGARPAVFLDRDGTVIEHVPYLADPAGVRLIPGVAGALWRLREAGYALVIVSNQSGIGRGLLTAEQFERVNEELGGGFGGATVANGSGTTQCPKCGAVGTYPIRLQNGGQVVPCNSCRKNFTAEVKQGQFTGRNR